MTDNLTKAMRAAGLSSRKATWTPDMAQSVADGIAQLAKIGPDTELTAARARIAKLEATLQIYATQKIMVGGKELTAASEYFQKAAKEALMP